MTDYDKASKDFERVMEAWGDDEQGGSTAVDEMTFRPFNLVVEAGGDSGYLVHPEWMAVELGPKHIRGLQKVADAAKHWQAMTESTPGMKKSKKPQWTQFDASISPADPKWVVLQRGVAVMENVNFVSYKVTADGIQFVGDNWPVQDDPAECLSVPLKLDDLLVALHNRVEGARQGNLLWVTPDTLVANSRVESSTLAELQEKAALVLSIVAEKAHAAAA